MRKLIYLLVVIVALGLIVVGCFPVVPPAEQDEPELLLNKSPDVINVPDNYSTIQEAIDAADPFDTIEVEAGTYNENIVIDKSLTVVSVDGAEVTIIHAQPSSFGVLIIEGTTIATFEGFTVENYNRVGILAGSFSLSEEDPLEVHILNNIIKEPMSQQNNNCIQVGDGTTGTIIGNEVFGAFLQSPDWSGSGILVAGSNNVLVSDNYVHDCEGGIQVLGYAEYRDAPAENNIIENNLVENCVTGVSIQMNSIGTLISYNNVLNNDGGIAVMAMDSDTWGGGEHSAPSGTEIHYNNIFGNTEYGMKSSKWYAAGVVSAEQVDATRNHWGSPTGPCRQLPNGNWVGKGDKVSGNVDYVPWLPHPMQD